MPTHALTPLLADLQARLPEVMLRDQHRLRWRIDGIRRVRNPKARQAIAEQIGAELDAAAERLATRRAAAPTVSYPAELPVSQKKDDIAAASSDTHPATPARRPHR